MVFGGLVVVLYAAVVHGIGDIKEGDCLTFPEVQSVLEVERTDIYQGGECDKDYGVDGVVTQKLACGLQMETGEWHRKMVKHKMPGFFPFGAPCYESPEFSSYENTTSAEPESGLACVKENTKVVKYQQEKLETKKFSIASGEAYLPNPLWVHREKFGIDDRGEFARLSCTEAEVKASYVGWGKFRARWVEKECESDKASACREAELVASKNDKDQTCALIEKLTDCH